MLMEKIIAGLLAYAIFIFGGAFLVSGKDYWQNVRMGLLTSAVLSVFFGLIGFIVINSISEIGFEL